MKIGIDCITLTYQVTGIGRYTKNLLEALSKIDRENEYFLFYPGNISMKPEVGENFHLTQVNSSKGVMWHQFALPNLAKSCTVDILHSPGNFGLPVRKKCRHVLTIHDLIPIKFKDYLKNFPENQIYQFFQKQSAKSADIIIADSENTKKDAVSLLKIPEERIDVIYLAADKRFNINNNPDLQKVFSKYSIQAGYLLHLGGIGFNKNTDMVIEAYKKVVDKFPQCPHLVIIGNKKWLLRQMTYASNLDAKITFTGYVSDEDLPSLYSGALAFIYPSLYEGFGFPVLEAMASGIPVISSATSSLPEVVGDAGLLVDPENPSDIAEKIFLLINDEKLRNSLREKGTERVSKFSWEQTAGKVLEVYKKLLIHN